MAVLGCSQGDSSSARAAEVNVVRARRLWPRSLLQPPLTQPDQRALTDLAKQEERRPEQSVEVTFTPQPEPGQRNGSTDPGADRVN